MNRIAAIAISATIACTACIAGKNKVTHDFPSEMKPEIKAQYISMWEKGKVLYGMNCAKCHNTKVKGREVIPDFTQEQIVGYEFRVKNQKHETSLTEQSLSPEELGYIVTFFTYKKK